MFNSYNQNPYFNSYFNPQQPQPVVPIKYNTGGLQGKSIDNLEVVKAMDIPLDREYQLLSACRWKCDSHKTTSTRWYK